MEMDYRAQAESWMVTAGVSALRRLLPQSDEASVVGPACRALCHALAVKSGATKEVEDDLFESIMAQIATEKGPATG